ncbi:Uncharacterized acetyltransferase At3g50280 [Linum perenne]
MRSRENPDPESETRFVVQVGFRSRFESKFPAHYFGNAIGGCTITMKVKQLLKEEGGLGHVAAEVKVGGFTVLSGSPRFDAYGVDFGWGKPVAVRSGWGNKYDGKVTVYPGAEAGSMDFEICLSPDSFDRLRSDSEFMAAVTE